MLETTAAADWVPIAMKAVEMTLVDAATEAPDAATPGAKRPSVAKIVSVEFFTVDDIVLIELFIEAETAIAPTLSAIRPPAADIEIAAIPARPAARPRTPAAVPIAAADIGPRAVTTDPTAAANVAAPPLEPAASNAADSALMAVSAMGTTADTMETARANPSAPTAAATPPAPITTRLAPRIVNVPAIAARASACGSMPVMALTRACRATTPRPPETAKSVRPAPIRIKPVPRTSAPAPATTIATPKSVNAPAMIAMDPACGANRAMACPRIYIPAAAPAAPAPIPTSPNPKRIKAPPAMAMARLIASIAAARTISAGDNGPMTAPAIPRATRAPAIASNATPMDSMDMFPSIAMLKLITRRAPAKARTPADCAGVISIAAAPRTRRAAPIPKMPCARTWNGIVPSKISGGTNMLIARASAKITPAPEIFPCMATTAAPRRSNMIAKETRPCEMTLNGMTPRMAIAPTIPLIAREMAISPTPTRARFLPSPMSRIAPARPYSRSMSAPMP